MEWNVVLNLARNIVILEMRKNVNNMARVRLTANSINGNMHNAYQWEDAYTNGNALLEIHNAVGMEKHEDVI